MSRTLFILGAGASKSVYQYFPTGFELIQIIHSHLFNDKNDVIRRDNEGEYVSDLTNKLVSILKKESSLINYEIELKKYKKELYNYLASWEVKIMRADLNVSRSIDDFTEINKHYEYFLTISKYATAHMLKGTENAYYEARNKKINNWIKSLCDKLHTYSEEDILKNFYFISFNYDRLLIYLFSKYLLANNSAISSTFFAEFEKSNIYYMYGSLGSLTEMPFDSNNDKMDEMINAYTRFDLLEKGRERKNWKPDETFDKVGFIGFGFDKANFYNLNLNNFTNSIVYSTYYSENIPQNHKKLLETIFDTKKIEYCDDPEKLINKITC